MATNEALDETIRHQIEMIKFSNNVVFRILSTLAKAEVDISERLAQVLTRLDPERFTPKQLDSILKSINAINEAAYKNLKLQLEGDLKDFAEIEAAWNKAVYAEAATAMGVQASFKTVAVESVYAAALARPFQGQLLREWIEGLRDQTASRIRTQIRLGFSEGLTIQQLIQKIRGTRKLKYKDGILNISRRHAESIARTAIGHMAATVRERFQEDNSDLLGDVVWLSTLDSRTSQECRIRDGKRYTSPDPHKPKGHSLPWLSGPGRLHWQCRSTSVLLLAGQTSLFGTRASADGQVKATMNYGQWLKTQSTQVQDDVLGKTRAILFRKGSLEITDFSNNRGQMFTIEQLRERHETSFKKAGL